MRRALLVVALGVVALVAAVHASAQKPSANALVSISNNSWSVGGGSCQAIGGDFSVSIVDKWQYFHLIWTRKGHGNYRTLAWRFGYSDSLAGAVIGAKIKFAHGRKSGTFSGVNTDGVRTTGSFNCG